MHEIDQSNPVFWHAAAFVQYTNQHIFLTGRAGTGKTTFLNYIREQSCKKLAVVAPTGVAAINARGTTLHSFFQLPFGLFLPASSRQWGTTVSEQVISTDQLLRNLRLRQPQRTLIQSLELLIIDEVSMVRADVLDAIDRILRAIRKKPALPFGGVQMLFIGDLYQLSPVVRKDEWPLLAPHYKSPFFFHANVLEETPLFYIELQKIYRQKDPAFIDLLEHVRNNSCTEVDFEQLHQQYKPAFDPPAESGYITLTTHNYKADAINQKALERLPGRTYQLTAKIERDFPAHAYPADAVLSLKEGAQVMFLKNDKGEKRRYYNGKIGRVGKVDVKEGCVTVRCGDEETIIELEREVWKNVRYKYNSDKDEIEEEAMGSFCQFPLRLAWAVTIHKSQGLTFEKAIIDAGQSFAPGQVYVALSRLTGLHGLALRSMISSQNIMVDSRILDFVRQRLSEQELISLLRRYQRDYVQTVLLNAYDYEPLYAIFRQHLATYTRKSIPDKAEAFEWIQTVVAALSRQKETAQKFKRTLQGHLQGAATDSQFIHDRNVAAAAWFCTALNEQILTSLKGQIAAWEGKGRTKKYIRELKTLLGGAAQKVTQIRNSLLITKGLVDRQDITDVFQKWTAATKAGKAVLAEEIQDQKPSAKRKLIAGETQKISLELFQQGKSISEIAQIRKLMPATIEQHLVHFIKEGRVKVETLVSPEKLLTIHELIQQHPGASSGTLKTLLGDAYSYSEIKAVIAYQAMKEEA